MKTYPFYAGKSNGWREKGERYHLREHVPGWWEPRWREPRMAGTPDGGASALSGLPVSCSPGKRSATGGISGCGGPPRWREPPDGGASALSGLPVSRSPGKRSATGGIFSGAVGRPGGGNPRMAARAPYPGYPSHVAPVSAARPGGIFGCGGPPGGGNPRMAARAPYPGYYPHVAPVSAARPGGIFGCGGPPGGGSPGWRRERLIRATSLM
ncbi:hypothetical protein electrica_04525 [Klebsiella electrica]|nr:hypothetical protein electrica_04525 [Klebsiella electrica]